MSSTSDLKSYATSTHDFYELLSLPATFSQSDLDRAWRRTALKYHPDKVGAADTAAAEKFYLAQIGYDILSDPAIRSLYDNARTAREQKERSRKLFEGERKKMKEDLEAREGRAAAGAGGLGSRGGKRSREEMEFEEEVRRLAADGKRRRLEREEKMRKALEKEELEARKAAGNDEAQASATTTPYASANQPSTVTELDRSIKVRWVNASLSISKETLSTLFSRFGKVENAFLLKTKTQRIGPNREKKEVSTGVVVYKSVVGAHAAIGDAKKQSGEEWDLIQEMIWAANKEPDFITEMNSRSGSPAPSTPTRKPLRDNVAPNFPGSVSSPGTSKPEGAGVRKVPSFASFSSAAFSTPKGSPIGKVGNPTLDEIVMIRLREAEKKRLEREIEKAEEGMEG
ncbi:hypothetical protein MMC30_004947 [Trapelia coarctata]|nr:hypothetical protein [Trapelia coarctata]